MNKIKLHTVKTQCGGLASQQSHQPAGFCARDFSRQLCCQIFCGSFLFKTHVKRMSCSDGGSCRTILNISSKRGG